MSPRTRLLTALVCATIGVYSVQSGKAKAAGLDARRLAVLFNIDDPNSRDTADYYAVQRAIPLDHVIGVHLPAVDTLLPKEFEGLRTKVLDRLPPSIQSLALVWSRPYAVGCMSITTAFAAGYRPGLCEPGCGLTETNPLFDTEGWLPADSVGWWPAMLLPTNDLGVARDLIARGRAANAAVAHGTLYLVSTKDSARNVRATTYASLSAMLRNRQTVIALSTPIHGTLTDVIGYFTGVQRVEELERIHFLPGAVADHLTSTAGVLFGSDQMSALAWLKQGATASYGSVSEPCNHLEKFPNIGVLWAHYLKGDTVLEAYWKSVLMPGQGLIIGEPLARPFAKDHP